MIEIKHRYTGAVLYQSETAATLAAAIQEATKAGSNLRGSNLRGSNLRGSNLSGSNLSGSDLSGSDLSYSNLSGSNLSYSDLSGSDLRGSNLRGSNLSYSDLSGSNLSYSDLSGHACVIVLPVGDPRGYHSLYQQQDGKTWLVVAGCRRFTIAEARKHWGAEYTGDREIGDRYLHALKWLAAKLKKEAAQVPTKKRARKAKP